MPPGHGGAFPPISLPAATLTTSLAIPATTTPSSPSVSPTVLTRASTVLASSTSPPSSNPAPTPSAATIPAANISFTTIVATKPPTSSVHASPTITTIPPFTPAPADRLLYNGGLLAWSFLTMAVVGLILFGGVVCLNKREKENVSIMRGGVRAGRGGRGGKAVGRVGDGRYSAVVGEV